MQDSRYITMTKWAFTAVCAVIAIALFAGGLVFGTYNQKKNDESRWYYIQAIEKGKDVSMCKECGAYIFTDDEWKYHAINTQHDIKGNGTFKGKDGQWHWIEER